MREIDTSKLREQFRQSGQRQVEIVYDVDDVLWSLLRRVTGRLGIDYEKASRIFKINENTALSPREQEAIFAAFGDATMFEEIEFLAGAEEILRPRELGAVVKIKSNSFSTRIAELKTTQLLAHIPGLAPEDLMMPAIDGKTETYQKKFDETMTILVEDSPYNVALSHALVNVMPGGMAWSVGPAATKIIGDKPVVWRDNLVEINRFIYDLTREILR